MSYFLLNTFARAHPFGPGGGIHCLRRSAPRPFTHSTHKLCVDNSVGSSLAHACCKNMDVSEETSAPSSE